MGVDFSRIADTYDEARGGLQRGATYAAELAPHLLPGPVLEVGVGTGVVAVALKAHGRAPVGIDIAPGMLAKARERLGARVARYDGRRLPFADAAFASAYAVWVLHIVEDQAALFTEVGRVVRPGGRFLIEPTNYPPTDELARLTAPMYEALLAGREGRDDLDRLRQVAEGAGWIHLARVPGHHHQARVSAAQLIAEIQSRNSSLFWDLDPQRWNHHVEPALDRLRAAGELWVERDLWHELLVLERRGAPSAPL